MSRARYSPRGKPRSTGSSLTSDRDWWPALTQHGELCTLKVTNRILLIGQTRGHLPTSPRAMLTGSSPLSDGGTAVNAVLRCCLTLLAVGSTTQLRSTADTDPTPATPPATLSGPCRDALACDASWWSMWKHCDRLVPRGRFYSWRSTSISLGGGSLGTGRATCFTGPVPE